MTLIIEEFDISPDEFNELFSLLYKYNHTDFMKGIYDIHKKINIEALDILQEEQLILLDYLHIIKYTQLEKQYDFSNFLNRYIKTLSNDELLYAIKLADFMYIECFKMPLINEFIDRLENS